MTKIGKKIKLMKKMAAGSQGHQVTRSQGHRASGLQGLKASGAQWPQGSSLQGLRAQELITKVL
jgi:hypothetical protein